MTLPVNTRTKKADWKALVEEVEDLKAPHQSYEFSKKLFKETDSDGIYSNRPN